MNKQDIKEYEKLTRQIMNTCLENTGDKFYEKYFKNSKNIICDIHNQLGIIQTDVLKSNSQLIIINYAFMKYLKDKNLMTDNNKEMRAIYASLYIKISDIGKYLDEFNQQITKILET